MVLVTVTHRGKSATHLCLFVAFENIIDLAVQINWKPVSVRTLTMPLRAFLLHNEHVLCALTVRANYLLFVFHRTENNTWACRFQKFIHGSCSCFFSPAERNEEESLAKNRCISKIWI